MIVIPLSPLELIGVVLGTLFVGLVVFVLTSVAATLMMDHEYATLFWVLRWPVTLLVMVAAAPLLWGMA